MFDNLYCLTWSGGIVPEEILNMVFDTAQDMIKDGRRKAKIAGEKTTGMISTKYEEVTFGGISGVICEAEVDTDLTENKRSITLKCVVRPTTMRTTNKLGRWRSFDSGRKRHDPSMN